MSNFPPPPGPPFDPNQPGNPQGNNENPSGDFSTPPPIPPSPFAPPGNNPPPPNPYSPPGNNPPPPANPYSPPGSNMPPTQNPYSPPGSNMPPPQNPYSPPGSNMPPPQNPYGNQQSPYGNMPPQNPYGNSGQFPPPNNPYGGAPMPQFPMQRQLPNSTGVLVLGICSIVGCFCYGLPGLICGIIALILAVSARKLYREAPDDFTDSSYKNMNAGRVCAIIGTILSALYLLLFILAIFLPHIFAIGMLGALSGSSVYDNY